MARTPTKLAGPAQLTNSAATFYDPPAGGAIIRNIFVSNPGGGSQRTFTISIGTDAAGKRIYDTITIEAGEVKNIHCYIPLADADIIQAFASVNSAVVLTLLGDVIS